MPIPALAKWFIRRFSSRLTTPWTWETAPPSTSEIGNYGEEVAARYLQSKGCKLLYKNFRPPEAGEVDIIVRDERVLGFVEVKTRTSEEFGRPADAVNHEKKLLIARGAHAWLRMLKGKNIPWRCDIVEVILKRNEVPKVNWIRGAFSVYDAKAAESIRRRNRFS